MEYKLGKNTTKNLLSIRKANDPKSEILIYANEYEVECKL